MYIKILLRPWFKSVDITLSPCPTKNEYINHYLYFQTISIYLNKECRCGKSQSVINLFFNLSVLCNVEFKTIFWHCAEWLSQTISTVEINFQEGLPDINYVDTSPNLIIIDYLEWESNSNAMDIFTKGCPP